MSTTIKPAMSALSPGFGDPVADAQRCFRGVLEAMSRPGRLHLVGPLDAPSPLGAAAASVLLTLVDQETPLWLDPSMTAARPWIEFHCGAPVTADRQAAMFALANEPPDPASFNPGSYEQPETAATLILQLASLGTGRIWRLSGPGIETTATLRADGLPANFAEQWQANRALFPCGVDLILCAGDRLAALPRSITIEEG